MGAGRIVAVGIAAVVGAAIVRAHRLGEARANLQRYSMPNPGIYDFITRTLFSHRYDEIARDIASEAPAHGTVVDLGSGPGEVLVRLAALAPSLDLTGVDVDAEMVERANRKAAKRLPGHGARRPRFVVGDAAALPFPDESVDVVVSSFAVHHFPDRHAARAEIMRVLKPGGRALLWDIVSPHGDPESDGDVPSHAGAHAGPSHGEAGPTPHRIGALGILRMLLRFGRIPADRYELRKPAS